jgi:hypothetical protein
VLLLLLVPLIVILLTLLLHERVRIGRMSVDLRPLPGLETIRRALANGAETGRALHLSPGPGSIGGRGSTAETIAGLLAVERVATEAALNGASILASSGDATTHLALRGALRQAYQRAGLGQDYRASSVQLLAHQDPMAYASGVTTLYGRQRLEASQMLGAFDQELLLAGEIGGQLEVPQLLGATSTAAQPLAILSGTSSLIGEEIYAAEAYLATTPTAQARLIVHDALRTVVIVVCIILLLLSLSGLQLSL